MRDLHEGLLTALTLQWSVDRSNKALVSLVQKQGGLERLEIQQPDAIPALAHVLRVPGCLRHVRELTLKIGEPMTGAHMDALADALQAPEVLQALDEHFPCEHSP